MTVYLRFFFWIELNTIGDFVNPSNKPFHEIGIWQTIFRSPKCGVLNGRVTTWIETDLEIELNDIKEEEDCVEETDNGEDEGNNTKMHEELVLGFFVFFFKRIGD